MGSVILNQGGLFVFTDGRLLRIELGGNSFEACLIGEQGDDLDQHARLFIADIMCQGSGLIKRGRGSGFVRDMSDHHAHG